VIARGLARAGLADSLCNAARVYNDEEMKVMFLPGWLEQVRAELRTNASGKLSRKEKALANNIDDNFIQLSVLRLYISPITSGSEGRQLPTGLWKREPDLGKLAAVCELRFEWGTEKIVLQRFRGNIFPGVVTRAVRFQAMQKDNLITRRPVEPQTPSRTNRRAAPGTPSSVIRKHFSTNSLLSGSAQNSDDSDTPIITQVSTTRNHASTDGILEYRLEIDPRAMVKATRGGFRGLRTELTEGFFVPCEDDDDPDSAGARKMKYEDPDSVFKMWLAADMVDLVEGDLVEAWKEEKENKLKKKATKGTRKKKNQDEDDSPPKKKIAAKRVAKKIAEEVSDGESASLDNISKFDVAPLR
jgi:Holliday junction resolvase YEN1